MTRLPLSTDLKTRTGAPSTKDARQVNSYVEIKGDQSAVRKRPAAQGGIAVGTGTAQGGIGLTINGTPYFIGFWGDTMQTYTGSGTTWSSSTGYIQGDHVAVNFVDYWAISSNSGFNPTSNSNYWSRTKTVYTPPVNNFGVMVAVGTNAVYESGDNILWSQVASPTGVWRDIVYAPTLSKFVAVKPGGTTTDVITSQSAITWTPQTTPVSAGGYTGVAWSPSLGLYCAVSTATTTSSIITSPDGVTWTARTTPTNGYSAICWSSTLGMFAAVGFSGVATSTDGINWTARTCPLLTGNNLSSITYGGGKFVAVSSGTNTTPQYNAIYSTDGITWNLSNATPWDGIGVAAGVAYSSSLGLYVAVQYSSPVGTVNAASSPDGITWTARTLPIATSQKVFWSPGMAMFVTSTGYRSTDGINWSAPTPTIPAGASLVSDETL